METLPIYYNASDSSNSSSSPSTSTSTSPRTASRLSFPVSVHSLAYSEPSTSENVPPPPLPTRPRGGESSSRQSKRGSVMLLNNGGWGGNQQDWMKGQYNLDQLREEGSDDEGEGSKRKNDSATPSSLFPESTINLSQIPPRSSSRSPVPRLAPSLPPRPTKLSSPILTSNLPTTSHEQPLVSPSSCPPALSPFSTMSSQSLSHPQPRSTMAPPPLPVRSKSPRFRPSTSSSSNPSQTSTLPTSSSSSSLNFGTSALSALNRGFRQTGLKDRFAAGAGFAREWGGKGKGRLQEGFNTNNGSTRPSTSSGRGGDWDGSSTSTSRSSMSTSASSPQLDSFPSHQLAPPSSTSSTSPSSRQPTIILGIRVPSQTGLAFGVPLSPLVASTNISSSRPHVPYSSDPITGTQPQRYLPAIAYRCLEYLSEWGVHEEGIYRIPGRSGMVEMLKRLFDAGLGSGMECDLREFQPDELDPNAVASCFKNWLRSLPESLLGNELEPVVDQITLNYLGYTASSTQFLSSSSNTPTTSPNPDSTSGSRSDYLSELSRVFEREMKAENYYLLRAISYHLYMLSSNSEKNKMNLTNLRLILSPTLRLTPGFLMILVEERERIFSGDCLDAKRREGIESELVSPNLPSSPTFKCIPSSSQSQSVSPVRPVPRSIPALPPRPSHDDSRPSLDSTLSSPTSHEDLSTTQILPFTRVQREEDEVVRERERIRSVDLKLRLPEGVGEGLGLGLGGIEGVLEGADRRDGNLSGTRR